MAHCREDKFEGFIDERDADEHLARAEAKQAHTLLPPEVAAKMPPLYSQEEQGENAIAVLKLFTPWTSWTWYATEYDPAQRIFFGVVVGHETEFGYFALDEMQAIRGPAGLRIERDLHWKPKALKEIPDYQRAFGQTEGGDDSL